MADIVSAILGIATTAKAVDNTCTATVNGIDTAVKCGRDLTVAAGDTLILNRVGSQWFAVARAYAAPTVPPNPPPTVPPPKPPSVSGTLTVAPVETRTYRGGWRTDNTDLYQGVWGSSSFGNQTGCAFYGSKPRSLAGATVTSATVRIRRASAGGITAAQPSTLWRVTQATRPGGAPTLGSSTAGPSLKWGQSTTWAIPDSWAQSFVDGTHGGLAIFQADSDPYVIWDGKGSWSSAMTLRIAWTR